MPTNDFLPFATAGGANVESQGDYLVDPARPTGFVAGIAQSPKLNKVWRQSSFMSAVLAQFIMNQISADVPDDGDLNSMVTRLQSALSAFIGGAGLFSTGDVKATLKTVADSGWVLCNDGSIGAAGSGATTRANADTSNLFTLLWNNVSNTYCPVSTGRGVSAAADFGAGKTLTLPRFLGRAISAAGGGSGLSSRALGEFLGAETKTLSNNELASHSHPINQDTTPHGTGAGAGVLPDIGFGGASNTGTSGSGTAFSLMQPATFVNWMIKL